MCAVRFGAGRMRRYALAAGSERLWARSAVCFCAELMRKAPSTRKCAQFETGFGRGLRCALVVNGCENERTARKSAYFVRPCALAKIQKVSFKKRAKNAKNGGVKIAVTVCLWAEMSPTPGFGRQGIWGGGLARLFGSLPLALGLRLLVLGLWS